MQQWPGSRQMTTPAGLLLPSYMPHGAASPTACPSAGSPPATTPQLAAVNANCSSTTCCHPHAAARAGQNALFVSLLHYYDRSRPSGRSWALAFWVWALTPSTVLGTSRSCQRTGACARLWNSIMQIHHVLPQGAPMSMLCGRAVYAGQRMCGGRAVPQCSGRAPRLLCSRSPSCLLTLLLAHTLAFPLILPCWFLMSVHGLSAIHPAIFLCPAHVHAGTSS
jgi:hypothetical protein